MLSSGSFSHSHCSTSLNPLIMWSFTGQSMALIFMSPFTDGSQGPDFSNALNVLPN
ncbi:carboxylesterase, partial [Colletotrichum scovillei]